MHSDDDTMCGIHRNSYQTNPQHGMKGGHKVPPLVRELLATEGYWKGEETVLRVLLLVSQI